MPSPTPIELRRVRLSFDIPDALVSADQPEESYAAIGMSLLLTHLEPYLVRTMHAAKQRVTDAVLRREMDLFCAQEGQHHRQHHVFNQALKSAIPDAPALAPLEAALAADYEGFTARRTLRFNLAYAEGFEAFTTAMARYAVETGALSRFRPDVRALLEWHLMEELEHRTVAFDVYERLVGSYPYRVVVAAYAQRHMGRFVAAVSRVLEASEGAAFRLRHRAPGKTWPRVRPHLRAAVLRLVPKVLATYTPWYTPHTIAFPAALADVQARYRAGATG